MTQLLSRCRRASGLLILFLASLAPPAQAHPDEMGPAWHAFPPKSPSSLVEFALPASLLGTWRYGGGAQPEPVFGIPADELDARIATIASQGQRVVDFERYVTDNTLRYALVLEASYSGQKFLHGLSAETLDQELQKLPAGLLPVDVETWGRGPNRRWDVLCRASPESGGWSLTKTIPGEQLKANTETESQEIHLADFELLDPQSPSSQFVALWAPGPKEQLFFPYLSAADFHGGLHYFAKAGFRLADVEIREGPGGPSFAALFDKADGPDHLYIDRCAGECQSERDFAHFLGRFFKAFNHVGQDKPNLRLIDLEIPFGPSGGLDNLQEAARSAAKDPKRRPGPRPGGTITGNRPVPTHLGVLHDGGADVPDYP